jgi:excinuclease UvrABC nuclease subunit
MILDGFIDVSQSLKCGVYALVSQGQVVYVGKSKCMLVRIYSHRNAKRKSGSLPSWFPVKGIAFDEIHIQPCHPDAIDELENRMINLYKPKFNTLLKTEAKINNPFNLNVGGIRLTVPCGTHPTVPQITRRI